MVGEDEGLSWTSGCIIVSILNSDCCEMNSCIVLCVVLVSTVPCSHSSRHIVTCIITSGLGSNLGFWKLVYALHLHISIHT